MKLPLEKSEPLMTADGFYEKNAGTVSFFMRGDFRGEIFICGDRVDALSLRHGPGGVVSMN